MSEAKRSFQLLRFEEDRRCRHDPSAKEKCLMYGAARCISSAVRLPTTKGDIEDSAGEAPVVGGEVKEATVSPLNSTELECQRILQAMEEALLG